MDTDCLKMINHVLVQCENKKQKGVLRSPISEKFHHYFEVTPAYVEALIRQAKRIRYQVYYQDMSNNKTYSDYAVIEEDEYDRRSIHCIIRYRKSSAFAGAIRIILPDLTNTKKIFPIEKNENIIKDIFEHLFINRENIAEISPIVVAKEFKKRKGEANTISGVSPYLEIKNYINDERSIFPHISLGLFAATFITSAEYGITHWYALLEPPLMRLLETFEMYFSPIGPPIKELGTQIPTIASVNELLLAIQDKRPDYWEFIIDLARRWQSSRRIKAGLDIFKN
jgi:N-acyl amino acid synthase of PEP-CTERM/exosortase system